MNINKSFEIDKTHNILMLLDKVCLLPKARIGYMLSVLVFISLLFVPNWMVAGQVDDYGDKLGTVRFPVSCSEPAQPLMERGLALLHSMTYVSARRVFEEASATDPGCALAYWGQAMTIIHPLWSDPPSEADFKRGQALVNKAKARVQNDDRERAYIAAIETYFAQGRNRVETANLAAFEKGWEKVYRQFPKDLEAACFYALAHMATADPTDKTYAKQKRAGSISEKVRAKIPDHPGAHHYTIHAYDYPALAEKALSAARSYGKIAPEVPHALHMPTHIFTRLGLWEESITMNKRSAAAALKHPVGDLISLHYPHALDYLAYAYLQGAEDQKARQVLDTLEAIKDPFQPHVASAYTLAGVPARLALERQDWVSAASLVPRTPSNYPWDRYPAMEAITYFAKALGAARSGNGQAARQALDKLVALREKTAKTSGYWATQIEIQRLSAMAWLEYQEGKQGEALNIMRRAAELESSTEKHPVTPGEVLPARELLADMLLDMGRYDEALAEYEATLERSANRFNSLYGAGRAAELVGHKKKATIYYRNLLEVAVQADTESPRLQHARRVLAIGFARRSE
jgi:tetratricopeptide (TPR) repeat protein